MTIGSCHVCGATGELFEVESTGERLCRPCIREAGEASNRLLFGDGLDRDVPSGLPDRLETGPRSGAATAQAHRLVHFAAVEACPECRHRWGWV